MAFVDNSQQAINEMKQAVRIALEIIGGKAEGYAKALCPVGTPESTHIKGYMGGTLRNSISHDQEDKTCYLGTNVYYAKYVCLGTKKMKARPFLKPAIADHIDEYKAIAKACLQGNP